MKHESLRTFLTAFALAVMIALGGVGCLVTGFSLPVADPERLVLTVAAAAAVCSALFPRRRGTLIVLCAAALAAGYIWHRGSVWEQTKLLADMLSEVYDRAYGWGALNLPRQGAVRVDGTLSVWGCVTAMGVSYAVCCRKSSAWGLIPGSGMLALCLVVTDTVPENVPLFAFLTGCVLLLITGSVRKESSGQGSRLAVRAAVPVCLFLLALFLAIPREGYVNRSAVLRERFSELLYQLPEQVKKSVKEVVPAVRPSAEETVDLKKLGPQGSQNLPVMEVLSPNGGTLYLRGQDYDSYSGTGWESTSGREEFFGGDGQSVETVGIRTLTGSFENVYLPCFPEDGVILHGGHLENSGRLRIYETARCLFSAVSDSPDSRYLRLPEETAVRAAALLADSGLQDASPRAIGDLVRGRAVYDRNTQAMPQGETDFALWFLESGETGYCVHFATGAVVLLRAAGIPARYVTGYLADGRPGEWTAVTADQAHAWAEYYDAESGRWEILDATPAAREAGETEPTASETPEQLQWETTPEEPMPTLPESQALPEEKKMDLRGLLPVGIGLAAVGLAAGVLVLQRLLRLFLRKRRLTRLDGSRRCLALWQEAEKLARLLGEKPPEVLLAAAEKAGFSQHMLTEEELVPFETYLRRCRGKLRRAPWYRRAVYRWVYGLI